MLKIEFLEAAIFLWKLHVRFFKIWTIKYVIRVPKQMITARTKPKPNLENSPYIIFLFLSTVFLFSISTYVKCFYPILSSIIYLVHPYSWNFSHIEQCKHIFVRPRERKWWVAHFHEKNLRIYKIYKAEFQSFNKMNILFNQYWKV